MKKLLLVTLSALFCIFSYACSQKNEDTTSTHHKNNVKNTKVSIPTNIFSSNKSNSDLEVSEVKNSIKKYLDAYADLDKNISLLRDKDDLNTKEKKSLKKLISLTEKNDKNFSNYINNNNLPKNYIKNTKKINEYIISTNTFLKKIYEEVDKLSRESDDINLDSYKEIQKLNHKYKDKVNGREQQEIQEFLNKENIKTNAFKK